MSESLKAATNKGIRRKDDFYPTPPDATRGLIPHIADFPKEIWEPACGDGSMSKILAKNGGFSVHSTDLVGRGFGEGNSDFTKATTLLAPAIVTNPPFNNADAFLCKSFELGATHVAMLLSATFFHAKKRIEFFQAHMPDQILAFTWRLDFTGAGSPYFNCCWYIWRPGTITTRYEQLLRPNYVPEGVTFSTLER